MTLADGAPSRPQYPIESVDNALRILLLLGERPTIRLTEVSEYLGVATSTAHRLLAMLQYRGFVRQAEGSRAYVHGPALTTVAFSVIKQVDVRARLRPVLDRLAADLGETVHLSRLARDQVEFVDAVESPRAVRVGSRTGTSLPAHVSSSGKALLSMLSDAEVTGLYPAELLPATTGRSITRRAALLRELARVRKQAFAVSHGESEDSVDSVAIPLGEYSAACWALSISAPASRMTPATRTRMTDELLLVSAEVAQYFERT